MGLFIPFNGKGEKFCSHPFENDLRMIAVSSWVEIQSCVVQEFSCGRSVPGEGELSK